MSGGHCHARILNSQVYFHERKTTTKTTETTDAGNQDSWCWRVRANAAGLGAVHRHVAGGTGF
ncbi:hypothetical protein D3C73_1276790 [compost metagenome]